jgi:hypothetical protein
MVGLLPGVAWQHELARRYLALQVARSMLAVSRSSRRPTPSRLLIAEPEAVFNGFRRLAKMVRIDSRTGLACRNSRIRP